VVVGGGGDDLPAGDRAPVVADEVHLFPSRDGRVEHGDQVLDQQLGAEGAATIDAAVSGDASVSATGNATIRLTGRPTCTLKVAGSTSVSGCR